jgi:HD superfamily phosphohydrolase
MPRIDFNEKIVCDNVHGSIGISKLEQKLINTLTFRRLKKINHLGLADLVFPGAEHSRFAHSIGVMHLMSLMIDRLKSEGCEYFIEDGDHRRKQKLRLSALLHDIGHYPLSHLGEQVFKRVDVISRTTPIIDGTLKLREVELQGAAENYPSNAAKHEKLGEVILTGEESEIREILLAHSFEPAEIARIINGEERENPFFSQLMSSTLDCDRMDYMLRDAISTGTSYGRVDVEYILRNLAWDREKKVICFYPKAINAIEHFIASRYFYYNIIYHKTTMGFELMAKVLFYSMVMNEDFNEGHYKGIAHSFDDIEGKMAIDRRFLGNFNDEYFWYYLELYEPDDGLGKKLKENLLSRTPLRSIWSVKALKSKSRGSYCGEYDFLAEHLMKYQEFKDLLETKGIPDNHIAIVKNKVRFEEVESAVSLEDIDKISEEDRLKLVKIKNPDGPRELMSYEGSIIRILSEYRPHMASLYAAIEKDSAQERALKKIVEDLYNRHKKT